MNEYCLGRTLVCLCSSGKLVALAPDIAHLVQEDVDWIWSLQLNPDSCTVIITIAVEEVIIIAKI